MHKSERMKGKEAVAARLKQKRQLLIAVGAAAVILVVIAAIGFCFFNPFSARSGSTVAIYYSGALDNGTVVGSNPDSTPLVFTIGKDEVIPYGLPDAVIGMQRNQTKTVVLPPEKAFGIYDPGLVQVVDRASVPPGTDFVAGQDYQIIRKSDNAIAHVTILNVTPSTVAWDGNHVLAGRNLTLTVTLVDII